MISFGDLIIRLCDVGWPLESPDRKLTNAVHPYRRIFRVPGQCEVKTKRLKEKDA